MNWRSLEKKVSFYYYYCQDYGNSIFRTDTFTLITNSHTTPCLEITGRM
jgi:hypothetical protein